MGWLPTVFDLNDVLGKLALKALEIFSALANAVGPGATILADGCLAMDAVVPIGTYALHAIPRGPVLALTWKRKPRTRVL